MIKVPENSELSDFNIKNFEIPPLEKYVDRRGYIYILYNEVFPNYIKVGRTGNLHKRLVQYNSDAPFPTAKMLYISEMFEDVHEIERRILQYMYSHTQPTTLSKEWFEIQHKDTIIDIVEKAERIELQEQERTKELEKKFKELEGELWK